MPFKILTTLALSSLISITTLTAFADDSQATKDENTVVGACMTTRIQTKMPSIKQEKIESCSNGDADKLPKCLGMSDDDFVAIVNDCKSQLTNAKCVAGKMKVTLIQYADCGYEKDPEACYKSLGSSTADVIKLSEQCSSEGAK